MSDDKIIDFEKKKKGKKIDEVTGLMNRNRDELDFFTTHIMALFNYIANLCNQRGYKFVLHIVLSEEENLLISQSNDEHYLQSIHEKFPIE